MLSRSPSSRNIVTLERLLVEPELHTLALCFLNAFLPFKVSHFEADAHTTLRLFHAAGTFHDDIIVKIEDTSGVLHFVEIALLHIRPGNTWGYLKADQDYHHKFREKKGTHYAGRKVHCLYFMQFETDTQSGCHIEKQYNFNKAPYSVRFYCFELPKFQTPAPELCTDRDRWLYWLQNDCIPSDWEEELRPFRLAWCSLFPANLGLRSHTLNTLPPRFGLMPKRNFREHLSVVTN